MPASPTAIQIMAFRVATNMGINQAKEFIANKEPQLIERIMVAAEIRENDQHAILSDPLEDDLKVGDVIKRVIEEETKASTDRYGSRCGMSHHIWRNSKLRLIEEYNINWYSPAELNPGVCFD